MAKTTCKVTKSQFSNANIPLTVLVNGQPAAVKKMEFSTGSFGFNVSGKAQIVVKITENGVEREVTETLQLTGNFIIVGSKEAPTTPETPASTTPTPSVNKAPETPATPPAAPAAKPTPRKAKDKNAAAGVSSASPTPSIARPAAPQVWTGRVAVAESNPVHANFLEYANDNGKDVKTTGKITYATFDPTWFEGLTEYFPGVAKVMGA